MIRLETGACPVNSDNSDLSVSEGTFFLGYVFTRCFSTHRDKPYVFERQTPG